MSMDPITNRMRELPADKDEREAIQKAFRDEVDKAYFKGPERVKAKEVAAAEIAEGEIIEVKGTRFRVARISQRMLLLRPAFGIPPSTKQDPDERTVRCLSAKG